MFKYRLGGGIRFVTAKLLKQDISRGPLSGPLGDFPQPESQYIYTEQYPAERPKVAKEHDRGAPRLNINPDNGETLCIACNLCALACPENLIVVTSERNERPSEGATAFTTTPPAACSVVCEDACPVDALELTQDFELATYTREGQICNPQMLRRRAQTHPIQMPDSALLLYFRRDGAGGAVFTITCRNAVHSAISLIVSLLGVAGIYLIQQAEFLFAVQIVLYVGGIMVLFLFRNHAGESGQGGQRAPVQPPVAGGPVAAAPVAAEIGYFLYKGGPDAIKSRGGGRGLNRAPGPWQYRSDSGIAVFAISCCRSKLLPSCCWWRSSAR